MATAEYNAASTAMRAKTERLRALRLAKEEQDRVAAENAPPPAPKRRRRRRR